MELNQIRYVLRVAEYCSFSRAAISLSARQPTLTQQIGKLEAELGVLLFDRTTRTVSLTNAGRDFVTYGTRILSAVNDLENIMQSYKNASRGLIRIGVLPAAGLYNISQCISGFSNENEGIFLEVNQSSSAELAKELLDYKIDVAFLSSVLLKAPSLSFLDCYTVVEDEICLIVASANTLSMHQQFSLKELANIEIVLHDGLDEISEIVLESMLRQKIVPRISKKYSQIQELIGLVSSGSCVSLLPQSIIRQYSGSDITAIPFSPSIKVNISLVIANERKHSEDMISFRDYIIAKYSMVK